MKKSVLSCRFVVHASVRALIHFFSQDTCTDHRCWDKCAIINTMLVLSRRDFKTGFRLRGGQGCSETIDKYLCLGKKCVTGGKSLTFHEFLKGASGPTLDPDWEACFLVKFCFGVFPTQGPEAA